MSTANKMAYAPWINLNSYASRLNLKKSFLEAKREGTSKKESIILKFRNYIPTIVSYIEIYGLASSYVKDPSVLSVNS